MNSAASLPAQLSMTKLEHPELSIIIGKENPEYLK
jgi:hypothetical protein